MRYFAILLLTAVVMSGSCALASALPGGSTSTAAAAFTAASMSEDTPATSARSTRAGLALITSLDARDELLSGGQSGSSSEGSDDSGKMFALSFLLPGAGQLVQGEKRGYVYILAEVAFWAGFFALDNMGLDERDDYQNYADKHWDYDAYSSWYQENCVGCEDCGYECRPLAEYGTQEYYEDIGKYQTYWRWWSDDGDETHIDWDDYSSDDLGSRNSYWGMRGDSNQHLRQARYMLMAAFLNHIVSGVDSFLSARRADDVTDASSSLGLEFDVPDNGEGLTCAIVARY